MKKPLDTAFNIVVSETIINSEEKTDETFSILSTILENSKEVIYIFNYQTQTLDFISPYIYEITGYAASEIQSLENALNHIVHPDSREQCFVHFRDLTKKHNFSNRYYSIEYKIKPKEGISRWVSDNHRFYRDDKGNLTKLIGNIRDVTDFRLVEDALKRSRDRLYKAIEATNDGMWDWKLNTNKIYFDERFYTMAGYLPHEFPPSETEWMQRIHTDDLPNVKLALQKHLERNSDQFLVEYRFKTKDNSWIWVLNRGKTFEWNDDGLPVRMVGTHTDISLRIQIRDELQKRNEELEVTYDKLQISEEKFRQLAENTHDAFWLTDKDSLLYANPSFEKMWESNSADVFKAPSFVEKWIHPEDRVSFRPMLDISFENNEPRIEQFRIIKSNGTIRWIWLRRFPVLNKYNEIYRMACIATDITEQKNIESALISAKEKAMESDRLKSAFLANISHEIRTPMNGIIGFSGLLCDETISHQTRLQYVNHITKSGEHLLHIIDDIIDISKIESNQIQLKKTDFYVKDLIVELYDKFSTELIQGGNRNIKLFTALDPLNPDIRLYSDENRVKQIFMNLLSNAIKFTTSGYIRLGFFQKDKCTLELFVEDTGIGIPQDLQNAIFQRFRQVDESSTRSSGGNGLGLAICYGLTKYLGGEISLTSEINKGSVFSFTLPCNCDDAIADLPSGLTDKDYDWSDKTILIVEDDEINQEFLSAILEPTHAKVYLFSEGENAITFCNENKAIDIILLDIRLPKMNGFEVFDKIHAMRPDIPIVAQTAFAMAEDIDHCRELGFTDYISKPIDRAALLLVINKILNRHF